MTDASQPANADDFSETLEAVAADVGTPTYLYDESTIRRQAERLRTMVDGLPTKLLYAVKANFHPAILRILRDEGFGFDVVSPAEALLALRLGTPSDDLLYSANNMDDEEMNWALDNGLLLNIGECSRLERFGRSYPGRRVCVRVNPNVGAGHHRHVITAGEDAKFGIPVSDISRVRQIAATYELRVIGLHQHIGSGILDVDTLRSAIDVLLEAADAFQDLEFINFGGGLGIPYRPEQDPLDPDAVHRSITQPLQNFQDRRSRPLTFWFEPGRYLVAASGVLITRVTTLKTNGKRTFAGTDSGLNHLLRPALYDAHHRIENVSNPGGSPRTYDVTGNICESGDLFARGRSIAEIREGDLLAIRDTGAYGMSMASHYNLRPLPAEVLLRGDASHRVIRPRRSPAELLEHLDLLSPLGE